MAKREILHADETTLQVLHESGKKAQAKNCMWLYQTGRKDGPPIVLYEYQPSRKAEHAAKFLEGFSGYLHADGCQGCHKLPENIRVVGCWAHARRKFDEALNALPPNKREGMTALTGLESLEELKRRNLPPDVRIVEPPAQTEPAPAPETHPTAEERQELRQILWTMGKVLGEQTVLLEELSRHLPTLPNAEQTRTIARETTAICELLEKEIRKREQDGKQSGRRFSLHLPKIILPRPSLAWIFLPLMLAALWALWYGWGMLWNAFSPMFM